MCVYIYEPIESEVNRVEETSNKIWQRERVTVSLPVSTCYLQFQQRQLAALFPTGTLSREGTRVVGEKRPNGRNQSTSLAKQL